MALPGSLGFGAVSAGEAAGALRAGCCQSCREHSSVPEALPCERGMTEFPCLTGGRRPAAAGRAEKTPPGSSPWDRAQQSRQGEPWPPPAAATRPPRLGATAALGTGNPMGKQGVGGGKDAGSGHRRAAAEPSPAGRQEKAARSWEGTLPLPGVCSGAGSELQRGKTDLPQNMWGRVWV